jgi:hypothetical protein
MLKPKKTNLALGRFLLLIPILCFGVLIYGNFPRAWKAFWLIKDSKGTLGTITRTYPKRIFDYQYTADGKIYAGRDDRNLASEQFRKLRVGDNTLVFFSSSHPSFSTFEVRKSRIQVMPYFCLLLLLETLFLVIFFKFKFLLRRKMT